MGGASKKYEKIVDTLDYFHTVQNISGESGEFMDSLKDFRTVWKYFGQSGRFPDSLGDFLTVWMISDGLEDPGQSGEFMDILKDFFAVLETFQTVWKISGQYGRFPNRGILVAMVMDHFS